MFSGGPIKARGGCAGSRRTFRIPSVKRNAWGRSGIGMVLACTSSARGLDNSNSSAPCGQRLVALPFQRESCRSTFGMVVHEKGIRTSERTRLSNLHPTSSVARTSSSYRNAKTHTLSVPASIGSGRKGCAVCRTLLTVLWSFSAFRQFSTPRSDLNSSRAPPVPSLSSHCNLRVFFACAAGEILHGLGPLHFPESTSSRRAAVSIPSGPPVCGSRFSLHERGDKLLLLPTSELPCFRLVAILPATKPSAHLLACGDSHLLLTPTPSSDIRFDPTDEVRWIGPHQSAKGH